MNSPRARLFGSPQSSSAATSRFPSNAYASQFTELADEVRRSGLLERKHAYYWTQICGTIFAFIAVWVGFFLIGDSWFQLLIAVALGVVVTQFGFLGHDAAHRQIFRSPTWNAWTARVFAAAFAGLSYTWWRAKHNRHHQAPNQEDVDPDIGPGAMAFTPAVLARRTGLSGWFARRQGWWFFPLLTLEGLNLHVESIKAGLDRQSGAPWRRLELAVVLTRLGAYVTILVLFLPPGLAASFLALQMAVFGFCLGAAFAPAHKGMPIVPRTMKLDFLRRQVMVSRNIRGNFAVDSWMGGLNYQIEHHLFPNMPRCNLKRAQPMVRAHCEQLGITYTEVGLFRSYLMVVDYLNNVGLRARDPFDCPLAVQLRD
ncbi:acyl-CoA desaturase [Nocardioides dubius]